jgi:hypothetical protein
MKLLISDVTGDGSNCNNIFGPESVIYTGHLVLLGESFSVSLTVF